jgi:hypothetical protein
LKHPAGLNSRKGEAGMGAANVSRYEFGGHSDRMRNFLHVARLVGIVAPVGGQPVGHAVKGLNL